MTIQLSNWWETCWMTRPWFGIRPYFSTIIPLAKEFWINLLQSLVKTLLFRPLILVKMLPKLSEMFFWICLLISLDIRWWSSPRKKAWCQFSMRYSDVNSFTKFFIKLSVFSTLLSSISPEQSVTMWIMKTYHTLLKSWHLIMCKSMNYLSNSRFYITWNIIMMGNIFSNMTYEVHFF